VHTETVPPGFAHHIKEPETQRTQTKAESTFQDILRCVKILMTQSGSGLKSFQFHSNHLTGEELRKGFQHAVVA